MKSRGAKSTQSPADRYENNIQTVTYVVADKRIRVSIKIAFAMSTTEAFACN